MVAKPGNFHSGLIKLSHILYLASNVEEEDTPAWWNFSEASGNCSPTSASLRSCFFLATPGLWFMFLVRQVLGFRVGHLWTRNSVGVGKPRHIRACARVVLQDRPGPLFIELLSQHSSLLASLEREKKRKKEEEVFYRVGRMQMRQRRLTVSEKGSAVSHTCSALLHCLNSLKDSSIFQGGVSWINNVLPCPCSEHDLCWLPCSSYFAILEGSKLLPEHIAIARICVLVGQKSNNIKSIYKAQNLV